MPWIALVAGLAGWATALAQPFTPTSALPRLIVEASTADRPCAWVSLQLPPQVRGADLQVRPEGGGEALPLQIGPYREAWALLPDLPAGTRAVYRIEPALRGAGRDRVTATREVSRVRLAVDGHPAFTYVGEAPVGGATDEQVPRGAYIHPILTPDGRRVTEDAPATGPHHHGLWAAWARTRFDGRAPDFWNLTDRTGTVEFERLSRTWSGPLTAGFDTRHRYMDLSAATPTTVLLEDWRVVAYAWPSSAQPWHVFDLDITQSLTGALPLDLPPSEAGGLGLRGRPSWTAARGASITASGGRTRATVDGARSTWVAMTGVVDGQRAGIAIFSHPDNVNAPQPVRLHPTEPLVQFVPQQVGAFGIRPGAPLRQRYRVVAFDGAADPARLDAAWEDWARPVRAWIE